MGILKGKHKQRVEAGYKFKGDGQEKPEYREIKWDDSTLKKFPSIAVLAGVAAGLLGIGGGMVIGPLFITLDMQPKVGSSSCPWLSSPSFSSSFSCSSLSSSSPSPSSSSSS